MPLESTKPFTIINRPCLRVFIIITLQGGPDAKYKLAVLSVLKQIIRRVIFAMSRAGWKLRKPRKTFFAACGGNNHVTSKLQYYMKWVYE